MYRVMQTLKEGNKVVTPQMYTDEKVPAFVKAEFESGSGVVEYTPESVTSKQSKPIGRKRKKTGRKRI